MEELKAEWERKYSREIPTEFIARLECELLKFDTPGAEGGRIHALESTLKLTKARIKELNDQLKNEEFFCEMLNEMVQDKQRQVDLSALYAQVNKIRKKKQNESQFRNDTTGQHACVTELESSKNSEYDKFEKLEVEQPSITSKKHTRGSVKDKILLFERSDSSSGDDPQEIGSPEGDYARLVVKAPPAVSPKPASKRRPRENVYEEIQLPSFTSNSDKKSEVLGNLVIQPNVQDLPTDKTKHPSDLNVNHQLLKQEGHLSLNDQNQEDISKVSRPRKNAAPPVPFRRSKGKDDDFQNSSALKDTERTLKYSDNEPKVSLSSQRKKIHEDVKITDIHSVDKKIEIVDDDGEYCSIRNTRSDGEKHITLVQVTSLKRLDREKSHSNENVSIPESVKLSRSTSKSLDDLNQSIQYVECGFSTFKPDSNEKLSGEYKMRKLFKRSDGSDLSLKEKSDLDDAVQGTKYKSLSSSDEDLGSTVKVYGDDLMDKTTSLVENAQKASLAGTARRNKVPDYEKWTIQTLLTQTGISVAEKENLTDTGSDEETPYDNVADAIQYKNEGVSDDSGVCESSETSSTPDEKQSQYSDVYDALTEEDLRQKSTSHSNADSRLSTASCMTVDGNSDFHRSDSLDGQPTIPEDDDTSSVYSNDDRLDSADLEETLKASSVMKYRTEQLHMRHLVVKGILESEKSYLHVIGQLSKAKHYLQSIAMRPGPQLMAVEDITTIFYKVDDFYKIHKEFVDELTDKVKNWSDDQRIAESVKRLVFYFKAYEDYVNNYPKAVEAIRKYQRNEETKHLLEEQFDSYKEEAVKLEDVFLKPVMRVQTNHLVLHDLIKHTPEDHPDHKDLQKALRLSEENLRVYNVHPGNLSHNKSQDVRHLVKSGFLVEVSRDKKAIRQLRYVFLFSDVIVCTKHKGSSKYKDVTFKYVWYLPLPSLSMHIRGDQKYALKESLDDLKNRIGNLKVELRDEMLKADGAKDKGFSISQKRAARNVEKLKKKIQEQEATLVEALPRLPLHLEAESCRPHTFLISTDYEREEWREAIHSQHIKSQGMPAAQLSSHDIDLMISGTKLHMQVNGIGTALLKKDEEMLTGSLNVTIHKMQGLEKPCDVYCCMEMDSYGHFYKKAQTRVSRFTTDASWDQDFELDLDGSQTLRILCYRKSPDSDMDVIIGKCALELSLSWLNSKFNEKTISMNEISITISIRHTPASKTLKRTQSKLRTGIFGVRIENVTRRENKTVPSIVTTCVQQIEKRGLGEVGIYRVSGVTSDVQHFKKLFDKNPIAASAQAEEADIHAITGVLKLYFRELPEPLFTESHYQSFIQTIQLQNEEAKEKCMLELLHSLPDANYYTIVYMIEHLVRVSKRSVENKMSLSNLSTIFGPTLMHPAVKDSNMDPMVQMVQAAKDAGVQSEVVYYFIKLAASGKNIRKSAPVESSSL